MVSGSKIRQAGKMPAIPQDSLSMVKDPANSRDSNLTAAVCATSDGSPQVYHFCSTASIGSLQTDALSVRYQ